MQLADMNLMTIDRPTDDECWQAVLARDALYDGRFVTAVMTTGIYCRPSCPARHPLRRNVHFYADCASAEQAGFRPCKRCRPEAVSSDADMVERACRYMTEHL